MFVMHIPEKKVFVFVAASKKEPRLSESCFPVRFTFFLSDRSKQ